MECYRCFSKLIDKNQCDFCYKYGCLKRQKPQYLKRGNNHYYFALKYSLSSKQKEISQRIINSKKDVLVHAVCGAGKTEITLEIISLFLKAQKRVGFIIPRKILVSEIAQRLRKIFIKNIIIECFEKFPPLMGDIVVLTAHKIINYINQFDLVIIDEIDAFPLSQDIVLQKIAFHLARQRTIIISATPPPYLQKYNLLILKLFQRYHHHKLPLPLFKKTFSIPMSLYKILKQNLKSKIIVYFPTIKTQMKYYLNFKPYFKIGIINSKTFNISKTLFYFINKDLNIIFATSTLERGITIKNVNVIVVEANHKLFTHQTLQQISGRVGRVINYEKGWVYFLAKEKNYEIKKCIIQIKEYNKLSNLL